MNYLCFTFAVKTVTRLNLKQGDKFEIEMLKISRRCPRSSDNPEFSHFTLLFCSVRQINVQRYITHTRAQPLFCSLHLLFSDVPV